LQGKGLTSHGSALDQLWYFDTMLVLPAVLSLSTFPLPKKRIWLFIIWDRKSFAELAHLRRNGLVFIFTIT